MNKRHAMWYHVCPRCTAKFYCARRIEECRCGVSTVAGERHVPPWVQGRGEETKGGKPRRGQRGR